MDYTFDRTYQGTGFTGEGSQLRYSVKHRFQVANEFGAYRAPRAIRSTTLRTRKNFEEMTNLYIWALNSRRIFPITKEAGSPAL